jgi:hypothetical protein
VVRARVRDRRPEADPERGYFGAGCMDDTDAARVSLLYDTRDSGRALRLLRRWRRFGEHHLCNRIRRRGACWPDGRNRLAGACYGLVHSRSSARSESGPATRHSPGAGPDRAADSAELAALRPGAVGAGRRPDPGRPALNRTRAPARNPVRAPSN